MFDDYIAILNKIAVTHGIPCYYFQQDEALTELNTDIVANAAIASLFYGGFYGIDFTTPQPDGHTQRIVVNTELFKYLSMDQVHAVMLHEVGHFKNNDHAVLRARGQRFSNLNSQMEIAADTWAMNNGANPRSLLSGLRIVTARSKEYGIYHESLVSKLITVNLKTRLTFTMLEIALKLQYLARVINISSYARRQSKLAR